jgi:uncharacterized membrane protein
VHSSTPGGPIPTTADEGGTVRAQQAQRSPIRWLNFRERVVLSMWFVPALFVAGALGLSALTLWIDRHLSVDSSWLPAATPGDAETLAATVVAGMLTFTGVVFATTLVAIQLAGGQYSPRVVRVFVRSTLTHITLGIFLGTLVLALNALVQVREGSATRVPTVTLLTLYLAMLATLVVFITFCHGIVRLLRVQYLLARVTADARTAVERFVPPAAAYADAPAPEPHATPALMRNETGSGVIMSIDMWGLTRVAADAGGWVELLVQPGEYLALGTPVARVHWPSVDAAWRDRISECFLRGGERTLIQDPGFGLRQLVDIAGRALSPAINDPTTAVQAIDRITDLLATIAQRPDPTGWYTDDAGVVRVGIQEPGFGRLLALGYTEIALYGAGAPQVTRRLLAAFGVLEGLVEGGRRDAVAELRRLTLAGAEAALPSAFLAPASVPDRLGFG